MATATRIMNRVEKVTYVEEPGIELRLSSDEAHVIADIFAKISGSISKSRRGLTDEILVTLSKAGFNWATARQKDIEGYIKFRNTDPEETY